MPLSDDKKVEILLKEYDTLRAEILDRMKIAFSHLGYVGALVAFGSPFAQDIPKEYVLLGLLGFSILSWISVINWLWLRNCSAQLREIEERVADYSGEELLTWEQRVQGLTRGVLRFPKKLDPLKRINSREPSNTAPNSGPQADS